MDFRFQKSIDRICEMEGGNNCDEISMAGGAKAVLDSTETVLKAIEIFATKHHGRKIIILSHRDCGAYGGIKAFKSPEDEKNKLTKDLISAKKIIGEKFTALEVDLYFLDSNGEKIVFEKI